MKQCLSAACRCFSFIPRLVVHREEVNRIFDPQRPEPRNRATTTAATKSDQEEPSSGGSPAADVQVQRGSILLRTPVANVAALTASIRQLVSEIPSHVRSAPVVLSRVAADLSQKITWQANNLVHAASNVSLMIISITEGVEGRLQAVIKVSHEAAGQVVEMPHRASYEWKHLIWVLMAMVTTPVVIVGMALIIPLNSVNLGVAANRAFLYGTMTLYEILTMLPWIETCNFAMPEAEITVRTRLFTLIFGMLLAKAWDTTLAEGVFGRQIFPLPFSILISSIIGVLVVVPMLYYLTPKNEKVSWRQMQSVLTVYWISLIGVIWWAVGIQRLQARSGWQGLLTFAYGPLRFICKIMLAAPITTNHNGKRWIQLNLVVDMLFTRVQVATFPFIDGYVTLLMLFSTELLTLAWRYYNGIDRLALLWNTVFLAAAADGQRGGGKRKQVKRTIRRTYAISKTCLRAPIPYIAQMNLDLSKDDRAKAGDIVRTLTGDTAFSFEDELDEIEESPRRRLQEVIVDLHDPDNSVGQATIADIEAACERLDQQEDGGGCLHGDSCGVRIGAQQVLSSPALREGSFPPMEDHARVTLDVEVASTVAEAGDCVAYENNESFRNLNRLSEEEWEQRPLYHMIDSTGGLGISIIVRINQQLAMTMIRIFPTLAHLNSSFAISDKRWRKAQMYGWAYIVLLLGLLAVLHYKFRRLKTPNGRRLSLSRVMSYLFKDHFWFFFLWIVQGSAFVCASMVNHFGADFSFRFEWLRCHEETIEWPGCPSY